MLSVAASVYSSTYKLRDFAMRKVHTITDTFLSLVGNGPTEDMELLVKVLSCTSVCSSTAHFNPFNASCSKLLLFKGSIPILV